MKLIPSSFPCRFTNSLTSEQSNIVKIAAAGHNILVTGQGGTGKSYLVRALRSDLQRTGKKVVIVCASGIAGTVYLEDGVNASTVHSFYGLRTADLPSDFVVERAIANSLEEERVRKADTVIWDEISMSSGRVFELANKIHVVLSPLCETSHLFGGKQVILVSGDFLQLRPVSNLFDLGKFVFESPLFIKAIPHRFELKTLLRQNENEK